MSGDCNGEVLSGSSFKQLSLHLCLAVSSRGHAVWAQFSLPNVLARRLADLLYGSTLLLVFLPARSLAGAVAVMGKLTLGAAVQFGLLPETAVADLSGQTESETDKTEKHYSCSKTLFHPLKKLQREVIFN